MKVAEVLRNRDFDFYWGGVVLSQIGSRGTIAANLYQVYELSGSVAQTGLVGAAQVVALVVLSPLAGVYADRVDRRRLLQWSQAVALVVAVALAATSFAGHADVVQVVGSVVLTTAAATFDQPARQALIPALVPRAQLPQAFALLNPSRELAVLLGPALSGVLIAVSGPGLMYAVDAVTYLVLMVTLALLRIPHLPGSGDHITLREQFVEGVRFVLGRRIVWQMVLLDLVATVFAAYRVLLPTLAIDRLHLGATAYGLLSSAPSAGALVATYTVFRVVARSKRLGKVLLASTIAYGLSAVLLAWAGDLLLALFACLLLGAFDAMATTIRQAAVQLETPDSLRGRVSAIYQMASRGGPALGDTVIGAAAAAAGPALALMVGGLATVAFAIGHFGRTNPVRAYAGAKAQEATQP
ncbi:MFS transporter [Amycolatopsis rhabdoformis]|uniref:MFS transporter n=1 Tax=Amycolatopsis rhabdoformis TaxID=1448059 RepID=A0ABZ1IGW0_9PSEU|nr:MFS transporter [Amycolatopsis rhabdoformis]WSE33659.1 MFS transporter [Amycolatopsis rhabdoformis]